MILADTSVWVDHLRRRASFLRQLLADGQILTHPFVIGELALGNLKPRAAILLDLQELPQSVIASQTELPEFIEQQRLYGFGIGYVDAHLLASTRLTEGATLWTQDKRLRLAAERLGLSARLPD